MRRIVWFLLRRLCAYLAISASSGGMNHPVISGVVQDHLFHDDQSLVVREGHALATKKNLSLTDLSGLEWVVPWSGTPGVATFLIWTRR